MRRAKIQLKSKVEFSSANTSMVEMSLRRFMGSPEWFKNINLSKGVLCANNSRKAILWLFIFLVLYQKISIPGLYLYSCLLIKPQGYFSKKWRYNILVHFCRWNRVDFTVTASLNINFPVVILFGCNGIKKEMNIFNFIIWFHNAGIHDRLFSELIRTNNE